jgi:hypothetical protein
MGLDISFTLLKPVAIAESDLYIADQFAPICKAVGIYLPLWKPGTLGLVNAGDLIDYLDRGIDQLKSNKYDDQPDIEYLRSLITSLLDCAKKYPHANICSNP